MKVSDTNHVADFRDLYPSPTFPVHCNGLNSIRATQTGLSQTCHGLCRKHVEMVCVHDFRDCPRREVLVKVGVMEFELNKINQRNYFPERCRAAEHCPRKNNFISVAI